MLELGGRVTERGGSDGESRRRNTREGGGERREV